MREPPRRGVVRPCKQTKSRQWHRPPNNDGQHAKLVLEQCLTSSNDPWSLQPAKATAVGTLLVGSFSTEEEDLLIKLHALLGNRWSLIAGRLPGRTGEEVRNHWDSQMRAKLKRMGVDPDNHHVRQNEWDEHRAKHPGHSPASSEDGDIDAAGVCAVSDAGSSNGARQGHRPAR